MSLLFFFAILCGRLLLLPALLVLFFLLFSVFLGFLLLPLWVPVGISLLIIRGYRVVVAFMASIFTITITP